MDFRPYGFTKVAVNSMVQGLAYLFKKEGIRVNAVAQGVTASDMTCDSGTLTVVWTYQIPNEDGTVTEQTAERSYDVPFTVQ